MFTVYCLIRFTPLFLLVFFLLPVFIVIFSAAMWNCSLTQQILSHSFLGPKLKHQTWHCESERKTGICLKRGEQCSSLLQDTTVMQTWCYWQRYLLWTTRKMAKERAILKERYVNKGNNKITELRAILQRESQNS